MRSTTAVPALLRQMRVINWHSIYDRTIDVPPSGLLIFGTNGSGKTSFQDALQFALFPDASTIRFNAAAAVTQRDRRLLGYLLQNIEKKEEGAPRYQFKRRITYLAVSFVRGSEIQTFLVALDATVENGWEMILCTVPGDHDLAQLPLLDDSRNAVPIKRAAQMMKALGGHEFRNATEYMAELRRFQGDPHVRWAEMIKSSIGFKAITDATTFVRRFLADDPVDHRSLLESFNAYEGLRAKAELTDTWIRLISSAVGEPYDADGRLLPLDRRPSHHVWRHYSELARVYELGEIRLPAMIAIGESDRQQDDIQNAYDNLQRLDDEYQAVEGVAKARTLEWEGLRDQLAGLGITERIDTIRAQIVDAQTALDLSVEAGQRVSAFISEVGRMVPILTNPYVKVLAEQEAHPLAGAEILTTGGISRLNEFVDDPAGIDLRRAQGFRRLSEVAEQSFALARHSLSAEQNRMLDRKGRLDSDRDAWSRGQARYPNGIESMRRLLIEKVGWTEARPLCEMIDVLPAEAEWRKAVEAELGRARFNFVVPAALYAKAEDTFEHYRDRRDSRFPDLHRARLTDVAKIRERRFKVDPGSLAEKVEYLTADAKECIAYLLGRVHAERDRRRLRTHDRAVSPDLFYYSGFTFASHDPNLSLYIGAHARSLRLAEIEREIDEILALQRALNQLAPALAEAADILRRANQGYQKFYEDVPVFRQTAQRRKAVEDLHEQIRRIEENSEHRAVIESEARALRVKTDADRAAAEAKTRVDRTYGQIETLEQMAEKLIEAKRAALDIMNERLADLDSSGLDAIEAAFAKRIETESADWQGPVVALYRKLLDTSNRQGGENRKAAERAARAFALTVGEYRAQQRGFTVDVKVEEPGPLLVELRRLRETELPAHRAELEKKVSQMNESVVSGILNGLGSKFAAMERLVEEISSSTEKHETRLGRFKLEMMPLDANRAANRDKVEIYKLARESLSIGSYEEYRLAHPDDDFVERVNRFMERLLRNERERAEICDYRTYIDFRVKCCPVGDSAFGPFHGTESGGSGGEKQVPFYVMTFALLDNLYRSAAQARRYIGRLVLMDEVFHNMSDDNVRDVMRLAQDLQLQIIMVTPGKLRTLAPLFGKTLQTAKQVVKPSNPTLFKEYERNELPDDLKNFEEYGEYSDDESTDADSKNGASVLV